MNWFLKKVYSLSAQNRHDIHSPFLFEFIEEVLNKKDAMSILPQLRHLNQFSPAQKKLFSKIIQFYGLEWQLILPKQSICRTSEKNCLFFFMSLEDIQEQIHFEEKDIVMHMIHRSQKEHFDQWKQLSAQNFVTRSVEFWDLSILFFRKDFLIKQHFKLKY